MNIISQFETAFYIFFNKSTFEENLTQRLFPKFLEKDIVIFWIFTAYCYVLHIAHNIYLIALCYTYINKQNSVK